MKTNRTLKIVSSVAIVGTLAALALVNFSESGNNGTFLAEKSDTEVNSAFADFIAKHSRSFLTKAEFSARLGIFRDKYELVKLHNSRNDSSYKLGLN